MLKALTPSARSHTQRDNTRRAPVHLREKGGQRQNRHRSKAVLSLQPRSWHGASDAHKAWPYTEASVPEPQLELLKGA